MNASCECLLDLIVRIALIPREDEDERDEPMRYSVASNFYRMRRSLDNDETRVINNGSLDERVIGNDLGRLERLAVRTR